MKKFILAILFSCSIFSCSKNEEKKTTFKYNLSENGCSTEEHEFDSKQAYCDGLKDSNLNRGCALRLRADTFKANCPGQTW